jgi:hypothetical protein
MRKESQKQARTRRAAVPIVTIVFGAVLVGLGLWGRFGTTGGENSITSLIPAFVGLPLALLGLLALKESMLKHAMHAAAVIGLIGFLGGCGDLIRRLVQKGAIEGPSGLSAVLMTALCGVFVGLCVNSFIQARRRRRAREAMPTP